MTTPSLLLRSRASDYPFHVVTSGAMLAAIFVVKARFDLIALRQGRVGAP